MTINTNEVNVRFKEIKKYNNYMGDRYRVTFDVHKGGKVALSFDKEVLGGGRSLNLLLEEAAWKIANELTDIAKQLNRISETYKEGAR